MLLILLAMDNKYARKYRPIIYIVVFTFTLYYMPGEYFLSP